MQHLPEIVARGKTMKTSEEIVRHHARLRIAHLFGIQPDLLVNEAAFGKELKASFVSDFKENEYDKVDHDIKEVADRSILKELSSGQLIIQTVKDYCDHMVRCYENNPSAVRHVLQIEKDSGSFGSTDKEHG
jgi:hypothetical protein